MQISKIIAFIFLAYVLIVAVGIESINSTQRGGVLQNWHAEQKMEFGEGGGGSGQGKMRGDGGFQDILTLIGIPAYPLCVAAACLFIGEARDDKRQLNKGLFLGCSFICLAVLARFIWLGVFSAGAGIG